MAHTLDKVAQEDHYFPFGMPTADGKGHEVQPYKYSEKEYDTMMGMNMYDFHARQYDPPTIRFRSPDPMAEKKPWLSPHHYCSNNPILRIDPNGMYDGNFQKYQKLNSQEKSFVRSNPNKAYQINKNAQSAYIMTKETYGINGKGDKSDAFRHAYWQAINAQSVGEESARKFADAHEYSTPINEITTDLYMDVHNNEIGIEIGVNNPNATSEQIKNIVLEKIDAGELIIINDNNQLTRSNGEIFKNPQNEIKRYNETLEIAKEIIKNN